MARPEMPRAKLGWLVDGEFTFEPLNGPNRLAADSLASSLRDLGRLEGVDEATVTVAAMLGAAVDSDPTNAALWGQFRAALDDLRGVGVSGDDDAFAQLMASIGSADLRDTAKPEPGDTRNTDRQSVRRARPAADAASAVDRGRRRGTSP